MYWVTDKTKKIIDTYEFELVEAPTERNQKVVMSPKSQVSETAKPNSFLSDKNRVTDKEKSTNSPGEPTLAGNRSKDNIHTNTTAPTSPQAKSTEAPKIKREIDLADLGMRIQTKPKQDFAVDRNWAPASAGDIMRGGEYVKGLEQASQSMLNTKEFIFYSYFERVRKQLDQAWQPLLRERILAIYRKGRRLSSDADYTTRTMVTLNNHGDIVRVRVLEQSGAHDLDDVAIDALNRAGPYPNPPQGLVDTSGTVEIRWDFILKT